MDNESNLSRIKTLAIERKPAAGERAGRASFETLKRERCSMDRQTDDKSDDKTEDKQ